ncbi:hypothetical protein DFP74_1366 [Nocardiopsis sp. Huas11]|uniref:hypothetical protein n=1 Tax=Nocardiopsis sp. Huas11 TaxID=2183912 RepID=UPI000F1E4B6C|nr:hypothetical protein [Nocardiopsis sp. Huas11]RKS05755.1 hypothetical protein DFP74_1366 [Nocardiopsis sp. Huas11]
MAGKARGPPMELKKYDHTSLVFDPTLPMAGHAGLRATTVHVRVGPPGTRPLVLRTRRERLLMGAIPFVTALVLMAVCDLALEWTALSVLMGFLTLFLYLPRRLSEDGIRGEPAGLGGVVFLSLFAAGMSTFAGALLPFLLVHLYRYALFVLHGKPFEFALPRDRFVDPRGLGYEAERKLSRVQDACRRVEEAQRVIPDFDGRSALTVLREEEWLVARDLARVSPLTEEVAGLRAEAASDRVRAALRSREAAVGAAERIVDRRLSRIERYMRPVDAALTAYREWEQLSRLSVGGDAYDDLVAHTAGGPSGDLAHGLDGDHALRAAEAAIRVHVREADEVASRLTSASRADSPNADGGSGLSWG